MTACGLTDLVLGLNLLLDSNYMKKLIAVALLILSAFVVLGQPIQRNYYTTNAAPIVGGQATNIFVGATGASTVTTNVAGSIYTVNINSGVLTNNDTRSVVFNAASTMISNSSNPSLTLRTSSNVVTLQNVSDSLIISDTTAILSDLTVSQGLSVGSNIVAGSSGQFIGNGGGLTNIAGVGNANIATNLIGTLTPLPYGGVGDGTTDDFIALSNTIIAFNTPANKYKQLDLLGRVWYLTNALPRITNSQFIVRNGVLLFNTNVNNSAAVSWLQNDSASRYDNASFKELTIGRRGLGQQPQAGSVGLQLGDSIGSYNVNALLEAVTITNFHRLLQIQQVPQITMNNCNFGQAWSNVVFIPSGGLSSDMIIAQNCLWNQNDFGTRYDQQRTNVIGWQVHQGNLGIRWININGGGMKQSIYANDTTFYARNVQEEGFYNINTNLVIYHFTNSQVDIQNLGGTSLGGSGSGIYAGGSSSFSSSNYFATIGLYGAINLPQNFVHANRTGLLLVDVYEPSPAYANVSYPNSYGLTYFRTHAAYNDAGTVTNFTAGTMARVSDTVTTWNGSQIFGEKVFLRRGNIDGADVVMGPAGALGNNYGSIAAYNAAGNAFNAILHYQDYNGGPNFYKLNFGYSVSGTLYAPTEINFATTDTYGSAASPNLTLTASGLSLASGDSYYGSGVGLTNIISSSIGTNAPVDNYVLSATGNRLKWVANGGGSTTITNTTSAAGLVVGGSGSFGIGTNIPAGAGSFWIENTSNSTWTNLYGAFWANTLGPELFLDNDGDGNVSIKSGAASYLNKSVYFNNDGTAFIVGEDSPLIGTGVPGSAQFVSIVANGSGITALNADNISSGTVAAARLGSGSSITTKYLRGDNTWQTISGSGDVVASGQNNFSGSNYFGGNTRFAGSLEADTVNVGRVDYQTNLIAASVDFSKSMWSKQSLTNFTITGVSNKGSSGTNYNTWLGLCGNSSSSNITYTFSGAFTNQVGPLSTNWSGNVLTVPSGSVIAVIVSFQEGGWTNLFSSR
jgi:hypothetical protein